MSQVKPPSASGRLYLDGRPKFQAKYATTVFPQTKGEFVVDLEGTFKAMAVGRKGLSRN
ncbi:hypothetical protein [Mesorhizobium sp.]|uniref:hypothetical protein n=1 Tax=Mesorhizobium sp. TaxID=1871066 RepID=UPI0025BFA043|nr:hypothetical protein [Mesorhizobium sp.]